jgi:hypothetical protein
MRTTDDIDDPTWHDIFDRDDMIKRIQKERDADLALIRQLQREIEELRRARAGSAGGLDV